MGKMIKPLLNGLASQKVEENGYVFSHLPHVQRELQGRPINLFLDYDGTLTAIMETPDQALLSQETRSLLLALKKESRMIVVSGRNLADLKKLIGIPDIIYVGNHGAEIRDGKAIQITHHISSGPEKLEAFLNRLRKVLTFIPGVIIEDKGITASAHFRRVPIEELGIFFDLFWKTAQDFNKDFRITKGKKVLEIRPLTAWSKGDAVSLIIKTAAPNSRSIYLGDDRTDEDAYEVLKGKGISISVDMSTKADYYLKNQGEVNVFLEHLLPILKST